MIEGRWEAARAQLDRVRAADLPAEVARGALVVDIRPLAQRNLDGPLAGAVIIDRNVLEWRLTPTSPWRIPELDGPRHRIVVACNEGYASALVAVSLRDLGLALTTDLEGGYQALLEAGSEMIHGRPGADRSVWSSSWLSGPCPS